MLDLGTGLAWVTIKAKRRIGDFRVYIIIDVYKELVEIDAISNIKAYKLKRGNGGPGEAIYLIIGDFIDKAILDKIRKLLPEGKGGFNAIFLAIGP
jgi:hypothetical protein